MDFEHKYCPECGYIRNDELPECPECGSSQEPLIRNPHRLLWKALSGISLAILLFLIGIISIIRISPQLQINWSLVPANARLPLQYIKSGLFIYLSTLSLMIATIAFFIKAKGQRANGLLFTYIILGLTTGLTYVASLAILPSFGRISISSYAAIEYRKEDCLIGLGLMAITLFPALLASIAKLSRYKKQQLPDTQ